VTEFFNQEHKAFPCFHPPSFMALLGQQYSESSVPHRPAWWASLNAVLAIAQRRRFERGDFAPSDESKAWDWAANALGAVLEIMMRNTQLLSVQALLSLAWFFTGTPNPQPSFMLAASALRLAHSIGLHKSAGGPRQSAVEDATRKKVFWIAFSLDQELCLRTGRPSAQDRYDFQVDVPEDIIRDETDIFSTTDGSVLSFFYATAQLSLVQGNIYRKLYSTEALTQEPDGFAESIEALDSQLARWSATFAPAFDPTRIPSEGEHSAVIRLYYTYYNCVISIHRAYSRGHWIPVMATSPAHLPSSVLASIQRCLQAARSIAMLISLVPPKWRSFFWLVPAIALIYSGCLAQAAGVDSNL
jgi:hypothetical protein